MPIWYEERDPADAQDRLLAAYVEGGLNAPLYVLVAAHLALSPLSRSFVRGLESLKGAALEAAPPVPLRHKKDQWARLLDDVETEEPQALEGEASSERDSTLPGPLAKYLDREVGALDWKSCMPGLEAARCAREDGAEAAMLRLSSGQPVALPGNGTWRATLIVRGAFEDRGRRYEAGDLHIAVPGSQLRWIADPGSDCLCFSVSGSES